MKQILIASLPLLMIFLIWCPTARAEDPVVSFTNARNAFDAGNYKEAASRFQALLDSGVDNDALLLETHKYLGVSYIFLADEANAEEQFVKLLNLDPNFKLDPLVFPIDVVDFFTAIQRKHALRLEKIARAKARAEAERLKREEEKRAAEIERLRTTVYLRQVVVHRSRLVALMPLGAGQFQNGDRKKGIFFLTSQLFFLSTSIVSFALHENLRNSAAAPISSPKTKDTYEQMELGYRLANRISIGMFGILAIAGIVDAVYHFTPTTVYWKKADEKDVPAYLRVRKKSPKAFVAPWFDGQSVGLDATRVF